MLLKRHTKWIISYSIGLFLFPLFVAKIIAQPLLDSSINVQNLKEIVYYLADDKMEGRFTYNSICDTAALFIANKLEAYGVKKIKGLNGYFDDYGEMYKGVRNVTGVLPGSQKKDEIVIISAHYDHIGLSEEWKLKSKKDQIYNGANDNASGVAVMLALANYFSAIPHQRTIMFVAFSGEEIGMWGSRALCSSVNPKLITAQINLEMLGRRDVFKKPFITGCNYSDLRQLLNNTLYDSLHIANYFEKEQLNSNDLFLRSDNYPFARAGIPAHSIMLSTDADRLYHQLGDEAQTLNYEMMCDIAKKIAAAITPLVNGTVTPSRINVSKLP